MKNTFQNNSIFKKKKSSSIDFKEYSVYYTILQNNYIYLTYCVTLRLT